MKKIISVLICVLLTVSAIGFSAAAVTEPTITVTEAEAAVGQTVNLSIDLQNNPGIVSMTLRIAFDSSALTLTSVTDGGILGAHNHKPELSNPYTLSWANDTATTDFTVNGTLATLSFTVNQNAVQGWSYPVAVSYDFDNYDIYNKDSEKVRFTVVNGGITIKKVKPVTPLSELKYRFENNGICIIGYTGNSAILNISDTYIVDGREYEVKVIDESAFEGQEQLTSVELPRTLITVSDYAFCDCKSLKTVTLWSKNAQIGNAAFGCYRVSGKPVGLVEGFTMTAYDNSPAKSYLLSKGLTFVKQTKPVGKGDLSGTGEIDSADMVLMKKHLLQAQTLYGDYLSAADINGDGSVDLIDFVKLKKLTTKIA